MQITLVLGAPSPYKDIRSSDISNVEHRQIRHVDVLQIRKNKATVTVTTTTTITAGMPYYFCIFNRRKDIFIQRVLQVLQMMIRHHRQLIAGAAATGTTAATGEAAGE